jgi:glucokinase
MILAGDIGGTKTKLGLFEERKGAPLCVKKQAFLSQEHPSIFSILGDFLGADPAVSVACLGVAGPVEDGKVRTTNIPWEFSEQEVASFVGTKKCVIINDLVALSLGTLSLGASDLVTLREGIHDPGGARVIIAAGTGLGEGYLVPSADARGFRALPSEGGHAAFSPRTEREAQLLAYLAGRHGRVSTERVLSGGGIRAVYEFFRDGKGIDPDPEVEAIIASADPSPVIARRATEGGSVIARMTFDLFLSAYGAEAGDLALTFFAVGGVWVGGGIARKTLPLMRDGRFVDAFLDKGRLRPLMERIPLYIIVNEDVEIIGAAGRAAEALKTTV